MSFISRKESQLFKEVRRIIENGCQFEMQIETEISTDEHQHSLMRNHTYRNEK